MFPPTNKATPSSRSQTNAPNPTVSAVPAGPKMRCRIAGALAENTLAPIVSSAHQRLATAIVPRRAADSRARLQPVEGRCWSAEVP
ncbi:hypothetical protein C8R44DRAFT_177934 [Mycena epipterygia]|nr:hypothetical protein C8R44DRAFT_177934 [Mycena epipterygia]